nr:TMV resistance protein N-like isoform X2 [Nicotiana tomentosiformis]
MAKLGGHTHASNAQNLVGMESRVQQVYKMLGAETDGVRFVGIWGMSGIGKTTLARAIYDNISSQFEGACFLHEVRDRSAKQGLERLQEILLSEILVIKDLRINSLYEGANMQKQRLQYKKVLLVLDDVDHIDQLDALVGNRIWFGSGSRIIITTKDKHLLVKHDVEKIYRMNMLSDDESVQLFKQYAFKKSHPTKEFMDLSAQMIRHTAGLPLALKVLGSFLYGRDLAEWRSEVERLQQIPENEVLKKLETSFNGLNSIEQKIFLDIACFLTGKKKDSVTRILKSFNFSPAIGIKVLMEKSLITISKGHILMHQLIQELGWHIVRREASDDPRRYSRLWMSEDISHVLQRNMGTGNIEGISLNLPNVEEVNVSITAFKQMTRLRFLKLKNAYVSQGPDILPGELKWLDWHGYPSKSLPSSFQGEQLVCLKLKHSRVIQLWNGSKILGKLKYINLSHSQKLIRTPDFSDGGTLCNLGFLSSLVALNLGGNDFTNISAASISGLTRLRVLQLVGCTRLESFPKLPRGIAEVHADKCTSLKSIDQLAKYPLLRRVSLSGCHQLHDADILDALWSNMLKGLYAGNRGFSICAKGSEIPVWFTYKNLGEYVSVTLPYNWYTERFLGFAFCIVFDMQHSIEGVGYLQGTYGFPVKLKFTTCDGKENELISSIGVKVGDKIRSSEHTLLAYVPATFLEDMRMNKVSCRPNDWVEIMVFLDLKPLMETKAWGMRPVYKDDAFEAVIKCNKSSLGEISGDEFIEQLNEE